jgi:Domain of unknown function (DUF4407)
MSLFLWAAGAEPEILTRCPGERRKLAALGALVLLTACAAMISATFTVHRFMRASLAPSLLAGLFWGIAILTVDRWMVMSTRRQSSRLQTIVHAAPRIGLAVVAGLIMGTTMNLKMFEREDLRTAGEDKQQEYLAGKRKIDARFSEIPSLERSVAQLVHRIATVETGSALETSPAYRIAHEEAQAREHEAETAESKALCELDGTCGTRHAGAGPVYARKEQAARNLAAQAATTNARAESLRTHLLTEQSSREAQATGEDTHELAELRERLAHERSERETEESALRREYTRPIGLADRLDALGVLAARHPSVAHWELLLTLLVLLLDVTPVLSKTLMALGDPTLYEGEQARYERTTKEENETWANAEVEAQREEAKIATDEAELKRSLWKRELKVLVREKVAVEAEMARLHLAEWERYVQKNVPERIRRAFASQPQDTERFAPGTDTMSSGRHERGRRRTSLLRPGRRRGST